jgi:hypothetical protein
MKFTLLRFVSLFCATIFLSLTLFFQQPAMASRGESQSGDGDSSPRYASGGAVLKTLPEPNLTPGGTEPNSTPEGRDRESPSLEKVSRDNAAGEKYERDKKEGRNYASITMFSFFTAFTKQIGNNFAAFTKQIGNNQSEIEESTKIEKAEDPRIVDSRFRDLPTNCKNSKNSQKRDWFEGPRSLLDLSNNKNDGKMGLQECP